eukprot:5551236-Pyramimonas_sp.AAC.1
MPRRSPRPSCPCTSAIALSKMRTHFQSYLSGQGTGDEEVALPRVQGHDDRLRSGGAHVLQAPARLKWAAERHWVAQEGAKITALRALWSEAGCGASARR